MRIDFFGDEVERIIEIDPLTGELLAERDEIDIYPAKHFVTSKDKLEQAIEDIEAELEERLAELRRQGSILEAARLEERTRYDIEMLREAGYCSGIENYSRHLARRGAGLDALDAARLLPGRLAALHRRVAHRAAAGARHVPRRPSPASRRWSTTASGCRRRSTTGR